MTPTLGDFLTIAGQRISAAARYDRAIPVAARPEVIAELGRLLTVISKYASDGLHGSGTAGPAPVPTRQELTVIGTRLTLLRAAESIHLATQTAGTAAIIGHPVTGHLREASDSLLAGRDLVHTHDPSPDDGSDPLWSSALNARPLVAALMRELAGYAPGLARLTARLARPSAGGSIPPVAGQALRDGSKWLTLASSSHMSEHDGPGADLHTRLLHSIPPHLPPPRHSPADGHLPAAELCAGTTATAARLRHLALRPAGQPPWPSASAATSWRHSALAAAIIGHTSELLLHTLTDGGNQLAIAESHLAGLQQSADAARTAWQSWQAVTHAWDPLTTGTSRHLSPLATELDDLVLWIGRLARTGTWTPARANTSPLRPPADLVPSPGDIAVVITTIAHATDAITQVARQDLATANQAAIAGRIYSPARLLPASDDSTYVYRYRHASPGQIAELRVAYHYAITAGERLTTALDDLLTDICTSGEPYALARALRRNPTTAHPRRQDTKLLSSGTTVAAGLGPGAGDIERLLHDLNVTDPELLLRAIALDHATRDLTAEALAKTEQLTHITESSRHATGCHSSKHRNRNARLAAQDIPDTRSDLARPAPPTLTRQANATPPRSMPRATRSPSA